MSPALALPQAISALLSTLSSHWRSGRSRTSHYRHLLATHVKHIHPKVPARRGRTLMRTRIQPSATEAAVVRAAATLPPRHACQGWPHACRLLAARGTVYRHAIICGTVARITIATRPPRAAPTRHVTIRGCAPGTTGAGSQVPRVLSAKTRACGRASVPG